MSFILEPDVPFLIADDKVFEHYLHAQTDQYLCLELKSLEHALIAMDDFDVLTNHLSDMFFWDGIHHRMEPARIWKITVR